MSSDKRIEQQEIYAKELFERLQKEPFISTLNAKLTVSGARVHWHCTVSTNDALSKIHCFDEGTYGPQFFTIYKSNDETKAVLRTNSIDETISSVATWLYHSDIEILYEKHPSIDESKRRLQNLYQIIVGLDPELAQKTEHQLSSRHDEFYQLNFLHKDRSCTIRASDRFKHYSVSFSGDQVRMCGFREENPNVIAQAINSWLLENFSPTMLGRKFDNITFSEIAIYYEVGRPLIGEFIQSWKGIERFYLRFNNNLEAAQASGLITNMRIAGYDRTLRAGQSLMTLILSRSRRHGLRKDQPRVSFDLYNNDINVRCSFPNEDILEFKVPYYSSKELPTEIITVLDKLVTFPIS